MILPVIWGAANPILKLNYGNLTAFHIKVVKIIIKFSDLK